MVIKISKNKIKKIDIINVQGGITASQVNSKYKPDYLINLALYDMASGTNITHLKDEGKISGYLFSEEGIGIKGDAEITFCTKNDKSIRDFVGGSPVFLKNRAKSIDWGNKYSEYVDGCHLRSAIGFNNNEVILYNSDKEVKIDKMAEELIAEDCDYAINLDGGGSCHLQEGTKVYKKSTRKNVSWLLIYLKEEKKVPKVFLGVGHGGKDPGAVANGLKEKDINLKVATSCADVLIRHGVEVKLSRYKDEDDPIAEVVKECNEFDADLAVDFHINSGKGDGLEIFHHSLGANSKRLAQNLEEEAKELNNSRGLKTRLSETTGKDYYAFIRDTNPPAVIVESAFIDNAEDIKAIDEEEEQKAFGVAYAKGILKYLGIEYKEEETVDRIELIDNMVLTIGKKTYTVNGVTKKTDVAPEIKNGRTLVPIALLRELGLVVEWDDKNRTVTVYKEG